MALLAACTLILMCASGAAGADPTTPEPPAKPSSLAPHPTAQRSFGAPVQSQILYKRHKHAAAASRPKPAATPTTVRTTTVATTTVRKPEAKAPPPDRSLPPDPAYHPAATDGVH